MSAVCGIPKSRLCRSYRPSVIIQVYHNSSFSKKSPPHSHTYTCVRASTGVPRNVFSGLLCCVVGVLCCVSNKKCKYKGIMTDTSAVDNSHNQQRITQKSYVPSKRFGRATPGANGVPNKLLIAFLFSDHNVGVKVLKIMGLLQSRIDYCKCESQKYWFVDTSVKNGYRWRCRRAISPSTCRASNSISHVIWFQQSNLKCI